MNHCSEQTRASRAANTVPVGKGKHAHDVQKSRLDADFVQVDAAVVEAKQSKLMAMKFDGFPGNGQVFLYVKGCLFSEACQYWHYVLTD